MHNGLPASLDDARGMSATGIGHAPLRDWHVMRLRDVARLIVSNVDKLSKPDEQPVRLCNYIDVYKNPVIRPNLPFMRVSATQDEIRRFRLEPNDVVITKDSEDWRDIGVAAFVAESAADLICGYHLAILRPNPSVITGRYLFWLLRSAELAYQFSIRANGVTRYGLSHGATKEIPVLVPPLEQQNAIVRFLDCSDWRTRRYIVARQKIIALLNEHKQAIVRQTAFHGLRRTPKRIRPNLPWLGEIPEHWEIRRNGRLFAERNETGYGGLPILEVSLRTGVRVRDFERGTRKQAMSNREGYKRAAKGDVAYNMMRMWQGAAGVVTTDGLVSPAYIVARPLHGVDSRYYGYLFRTPEYMSEVDRFSHGIVKDRNRLYWEDFKRMPSPYPPFEEQVRIADAISGETQRLESAIQLALRQIELVREYRARLVSGVVTGQLDVRDATAALPDETDELASDVDVADELDDGISDDAESTADELDEAPA